ncbi:hypothetical protein [Pyxidicoccus xibeiensis]|uniref:hypothetical protein n=1 Tax=Pyxidicoccus xibeiensis TaxID=2906759 RepID=UPI0020A78115|nr:hypothetical protein [Pyxidicoccus xibeiensis]MCP3142946.1 hypothetical protein [Pyxidicoccus xibeiensis]
MRLSRLLPLCLAMTGCVMDPDEPVFLSGTVLEADGSPWQGGPLTLMRPRTVGEGATAYSEYEPWGEVPVAADGGYVHRLAARDTGADELPRSSPWSDVTAFQLHLPTGVDGAGDYMEFHFKRDVHLPPLRRWDSRVRLVEVAAGLRLAWEAVPPAGDIPEPRVFVRVHGATGLAWLIREGEGEPWLYPELLEDFTDGQARVQARSQGLRPWVPGPDIDTGYSVMHEAPPVPLPFTGRVPASRGADCQVEKLVVSPCPFTDGKLGAVVLPRPGNSLAKELVVRLRQPLRPARVIVRGLYNPAPEMVLHVEGSADDATWQPLGQSAPLSRGDEIPATNDFSTLGNAQHFVDVRMPPGAPMVTRVRLRLSYASTGEGQPPSGPGYFATLREVSVFAAP